MSDALHVVHGNMGQGKGLICVGLIGEYMERNAKIATNMDLKLENLPIKNSTSQIIRVADLPTKQDLVDIGEGWPDDFSDDDYDETKKGLLILDEATVWMNSREFNQKGKTDLVKYMAMLRKLGWDTFICIQDYESLDAQVRRGLGEAQVVCKKTIGFPVKYIGFILTVFWFIISGAVSWHKASFVRGHGRDATTKYSKHFLGRKYYKAYNTRQKYIIDEGNLGVATMLPLNLMRQYYDKPRGFMVKSWHTFFIGFLVAFGISSYGDDSPLISKAEAGIQITNSQSLASYSDQLKDYVDNLRLGSVIYFPNNKRLTSYEFFIDGLIVHPERQGLTVVPRDSDSVFLRKQNRVFIKHVVYSKIEENADIDNQDLLNFVPDLNIAQKPAASNQGKSET